MSHAPANVVWMHLVNVIKTLTSVFPSPESHVSEFDHDALHISVSICRHRLFHSAVPLSIPQAPEHVSRDSAKEQHTKHKAYDREQSLKTLIRFVALVAFTLGLCDDV